MKDQIDAHSIATVQRACHDMISSVGGYWPVAFGVCRLLEELAELNDAVRTKTLDDMREEAADVVTMVAAIANQYSVKVTTSCVRQSYKRFESTQGGVTLQDLTLACGALARCVLVLEGIKPLKGYEAPPDIGQVCSDCLVILDTVFRRDGFSLVEETTSVMAVKTRRDANRFKSRFDACSAPVLNRIKPIVLASNCPFAAESRLWGCPDWEADETLDAYLNRTIDTFERFANVTQFHLIDGLVLELPSAWPIDSIDRLASHVNRMLRALSGCDGNNDGDLFAEITSPSWQFRMFGQELFVLVISDIYTSSSSRYSYSVPGTYLLFQPEISFRSVHVPRSESKEQTRNRIRDRFAAQGQDYRGGIVETPLEAPRYIKPLFGNDNPVEWWLSN